MGVALVAMVSGQLRMAYAIPGPRGAPQQPPAKSQGAPPDKLPTDVPWALATAVRPVRIKVLSGAVDEAAVWRVFDGHAATQLSAIGGPLRFRLELPRATFLDAVAVYGHTRGTLSVEAEGTGAVTPLLQKATLGAAGPRWNRRDFANAPLATAAVVTFEPSAADSALPEIELWGRAASAGTPAPDLLPDALYSGLPAGARALKSEQEEQTISPATVSTSGTGGTFTVGVDGDLAAIERAFLVYELRGLPHFTAAARSINGGPTLGHFAPSRSASGGLQVEEIPPAALRPGRNRVQFFAADERSPESYRVSSLRVVVIPRAETRMTDASARGAGALRDGREATGWRVSASKPSDARRWEFASVTQPWGLDFRLAGRSAGTLTVTSASARDRSQTGQIVVKLDGLAPGWHRVPLDKLPSTEALALALVGGKEEGAAISELSIEGSPLPADAAPRIAITYPLSGECVNHRVHVRGFATPANAEAIYADGRMVDSNLAADGAFAFELRDSEAAGRDVVIEAAFPGAGRARSVVTVGRCIERPPIVVADDGRPRQPKEDVGAPYGVTVRAGQPASLSFAGVKLDIPAGAVEKDVRLTVRPLPKKDVASMDAGMTNVSPDGQAFRFGPHGMRFKKPIQVTLPYGNRLIPAGYTATDVRTFYYDEDLHRWEQVALIDQNDGEMVAVTQHFTDFVNATIAMPDHAGTQSMNPTSLKDMKMADPASGIALIAPPTANSRGTANLHFPIEVPPGRHGVQPDMAIAYDSDKQNGWLGVGWDLAMSSIQIDTRFGVPKYDGTETYLLDGEMLAPAPTLPPGAPSGPTYFQRRVEGRFDWIARSGTAATGFTWLVTTKDGVKLSYGATSAARLTDPAAANKTFRWYLEKVVDPLQNQMSITYVTDNGTGPIGAAPVDNTEPFRQLYPSQIDYTSHPSLAAAYHVFFTLGGPDGGATCNRPDVLIDGRAGFQVLTRCVLTQVDVKFQSQLVRRYTLVYNSTLNQGVSGKVFEPGHFGKSLLARIDVKGTNGSDVFYGHTFDYFATSETPSAGSTPGTLSVFGGPISWGTAVNVNGSPLTSHGLSHEIDKQTILGTEADWGLPLPGLTVGAGGTCSRSASQETNWRVLDLNGDGLPDGVAQNGLFDRADFAELIDPISRRTPGGMSGRFVPLSTANFADGPLSHLERDLLTARTHVGPAQVSGDLTNRARETRTMLDINGDGFPDQVYVTESGMSVRLADKQGGFLPSQAWDHYAVTTNTCDDPQHHAVSNVLDTLLSAIGSLVTPFTGTVAVSSDVKNAVPEVPGHVEAIIFQNNQERWRRTIANSDPPCVPGPNNSCSGGLTLNVQAGDRIYTQLRSLDNPTQAISWSPQVSYQTANGVTLSPSQLGLVEPYGAPIFRFDQSNDFRFVGRSFARWTAAAQGTVNIAGDVIKDATSDDLKIRVVRTSADESSSTVVFETTLAAVSAATAPIVANNVPISVGDTLAFEVLSDLPIDPQHARWQPRITYQSYCAPNAVTGVVACSNVSCVPDGNTGFTKCSVDQPPNPLEVIPSSRLQQQAVVFYPVFKFQPGTVTRVYQPPSTGPVAVTGSVTKTAATSAPVVVAIQGVNALYKKYVFAPGEVGSVPFAVTTPTLSAGSEVFFTVYSDTDASSAISWTPVVAGTPQPVTFRSRAAGTQRDPSGIGVIEKLAGGYHGWTFGLWNGAAPFDETQLAPGAATTNLFPGFMIPPPVPPANGGESLEGCGIVCVVTVITVGPAVLADPGTAVTIATTTGAAAAPAGAGLAAGLWVLDKLCGGRGPGNWLDCSNQRSLRLTTSTNGDVSLSFPPLSGGMNWGSAASRLDMIDMNGDRYPDAVTSAGTLFNTGTAFEPATSSSMALPLGDLRTLKHFNVHVGVSADGTQNLTDAQGNSSGFNVSGGLGLGLTYGMSVKKVDLVDMNGDGLPDHITADPATGNVLVRLNLGSKFGKEIRWAGRPWTVRSAPQGGNAIQELLSEFGVQVDTDWLRLEDTAANNRNVSGGVGSAGYGVNGDHSSSDTLIRTLVDLVDVNGDGLPDHVMKAPGSSYISVRMNLGGKLDAEKRIQIADWGAGVPNGVPTGLLSGLGLTSADDSLAYTLASSGAWTIGGSVATPCFLECIFGGSYTESNGDVWETMSFEDIDGDGRLDQVLKANGAGAANANVYARLNVSGKTNRLKHVTRPLGGSFDLDYQRTGNLRASLPGMEVDMPANQWTLAQVSLDDGRGGTYIDTFEYGFVFGRPDLGSSFYDRAEREDYGYGHVATIHGLPDGSGGFTGGDGSRVERWYHNQDYYRRGALRAEFEEDHTGTIFRGTIVKYKDPKDATPAPALRTGTFFPAESDRFTLFYEGSSNNAFSEQASGGTGAFKSKHEVRAFDGRGNLTDHFDFGDEQTVDDDLHHVILSTDEAGTHITRATSVEAIWNPAATTLRKRTAVYAPSTGTLTTLTNVVSGGKVPGSGNPGTTYNEASANYGFTYDAFGNLQTIKDPTGYQLKYTYDTTTGTHPTRVDDLSFTFASSSTYDFRFGAPLSSTDVNGEVESYTYDAFGRLCTVKGPDDQTATESTITMGYSVNPASCPNGLPAGSLFPAYAYTRHKDVQHPGDPIDTVTFIDGIGRAIQTRKDAQFDLQADGRVVLTGMNVSGQVLFDSRGRVSSQAQPEFGTGITPTQFFVGGVTNPTVFGYDELGRQTSVNVPDGTQAGIQTTTTYSIATPETQRNLGDGKRWLLTEMIDPRGYAHDAYANSRGNQIGVREFNQIGTGTSLSPLTTKYVYDALDQLTSVLDAKGNGTSTVYDTAGRMVTLASPDAGQTEYRYDLNGNLTEKQTALLRAANQTIKYVYDFNRLKQIRNPTSPDVTYTYGVAADAGTNAGNIAGRIKSVTFDNGSELRFYDSMGNVRETRTTLNRMSTTTGLPASMTFNMKYTYDWLGRMQTMTFPNWINQTFGFVSGEGEKVTYSYDLGGNIDRITGHHQTPNPQQTSHPVDFVYLDHTGYDQFSSRRVLISGNGIQNKYGYDAAHRLTSLAAAAKGTQEVQQNRPPTPFHALQYEYDKNGNITRMKNEVSVQPWRTASVFVGPNDVSYTYDALNQLRTMTAKYRPEPAYGYQSADTYTYDEIGNIKTKAQSQDRLVWDNQTVNTQDLDPVATQLAGSRFDHNVAGLTYNLSYQYTGTRPHATNSITETPAGSAATNRPYSYDANGNNTGNTFQNNVRAQIWDEENRLKQVTKNGGSLAQFRYNDAGERTKKLTSAGDSWYVNQYFALLPGNRPTKHIFAGETRVATKTDTITMQTPVLHYYHPDHLGTTNYLSDKDQNLVQHERYFAYGELWRPGGEKEETDLSRPNGDRREWLFTGKEWDVDTDLYYFGARYFDPHTDVWQSTDPILASYMRGGPSGGVFAPRNLGLYTYAWNNPVILRDPTGLNLMYAEPRSVPNDFVGPLMPGTVRLPAPPTEKELLARDAANLRAGQENYATIRGPMGSNIAGGFFGALFFGIASGLTRDEKKILAGSSMGGAVDQTLGALAMTAGGATRGGGETTTLYRAVGPSELADLKTAGFRYRVAPGGTEGKYFFETPEQASNFARMMGDKAYTTTSVQVSPAELGRGQPINPAREGPGYFFTTPNVPSGPVTIFNFSVVP